MVIGTSDRILFIFVLLVSLLVFIIVEASCLGVIHGAFVLISCRSFLKVIIVTGNAKSLFEEFDLTPE